MLNWKPRVKIRRGRSEKQWKGILTRNINIYWLRPTDAESRYALDESLKGTFGWKSPRNNGQNLEDEIVSLITCLSSSMH